VQSVLCVCNPVQLVVFQRWPLHCLPVPVIVVSPPSVVVVAPVIVVTIALVVAVVG